MERKDVYAKRVQAQLDEWDADIKKLKARANQAEANAQLEIHKHLETLRRKRKEAGDRLAELRTASDDAWEDIKDGLESAKDSLSNAVKSAMAKFK